MNDPKYCAFALGHLNHQSIGNKISACFRCSATFGRYDQDLLSNVINNEAAKQHRKTLMNGNWPIGCRSCQDFEDHGVHSTRLGRLADSNVDQLLENYDPESGEIKRVHSIEIRHNNTCNLTCRHCGPAFSSRWEAIERMDPSVHTLGLGRSHESHTYRTAPGYFEDIIENIVPTLTQIMFSGGETLYTKEHYEFIESIPPEHAEHIELLYVINGTVIELKNHSALKIWKKFKDINVVVSTDGVGEQYNYFRQGADWKIVEENIRRIKGEGYNVSSEITCSVYQMFYLTDTFDYLYDNKVVSYVSSAIVQYPNLINSRILPAYLKQELYDQMQRWVGNINDPIKRAEAKKIIDQQAGHMMQENANIYDIGDPTPTWDDFSKSVRFLDKLFKTSVDVSFSRLAKHLTC